MASSSADLDMSLGIDRLAVGTAVILHWSILDCRDRIGVRRTWLGRWYGVLR